MKADNSLINEYKQHIQSQAKYITPENFKELGELINGEIGLLTHYRVSDVWLSLVIATLTRCAEYLNVSYCLYGEKKQTEFPKTPFLIYKNLSRMMHYLEHCTELCMYEPYSNQVWDKVDTLLEGEICLQEHAHWFDIHEYFNVKGEEIPTELNTKVAKGIIALDGYSDRIPIYVDEENCDTKTLALTVLLEIRKRYETIDILTLQRYIGYKDTNIPYSFGKAQYMVIWLANHGYIESKKENDDNEDLGYGTRIILKTPEEISEILNSDRKEE